MPDLMLRLVRRVTSRTPERWKAAARAVRLDRSYTLNTRGISPNAEIMRWFGEHGRPVSIVIPSYNDVALLSEALASIADTCDGVEYEVIIVDDYIDDDVSAQLREFSSDRVTVVFKDKRLGFAGTVNAGMAIATHDIILLNSDIVAKPGWVQALQHAAYAVDDRIGMVSPMLVYPDGRIQYAGTYYARLLAPQWFGHLHVGSPATRSNARVPGYNRSISGACVYITRHAFERVGLLDDEFWLGFEDVDYGLRAWDRGIRCYYEPAALLVHHESASRGYSQGHRELASMRRFWRRWQDRLLTRRIADGASVDFVLGIADDIWADYVESLAAAVRAEGRQARVHHAFDGAVDEDLVASLAGSPAVVVACDWIAAQTVWLSTVNAGLPVYLLPAMESVFYPHEPERQAEIVAGYRSEFDYIAPNRWTQRQLQAEAAWEVRARISPALLPAPLPEQRGDGVVTIGASPAQLRAITDVAARGGVPVTPMAEVVTAEALRLVAEYSPRAVVDLSERQSSLVPFALMSLGAAYIAPAGAQLSHDVLDGYNALTFAPGDLDALARAVGDVIERDEVWAELRANGHDSAVRAASVAGREFVRALESFAEVVA